MRSLIIALKKAFRCIGSRYTLAGVAAFVRFGLWPWWSALSPLPLIEKCSYFRIEPSDYASTYPPTSREGSGTLQAIYCGRGKTSDLLEMGAADKQRGRCYGGISIHSVASMRVSDSFCLCMGQSYNENLGLSR